MSSSLARAQKFGVSHPKARGKRDRVGLEARKLAIRKRENGRGTVVGVAILIVLLGALAFPAPGLALGGTALPAVGDPVSTTTASEPTIAAATQTVADSTSSDIPTSPADSSPPADAPTVSSPPPPPPPADTTSATSDPPAAPSPPVEPPPAATEDPAAAAPDASSPDTSPAAGLESPASTVDEAVADVSPVVGQATSAPVDSASQVTGDPQNDSTTTSLLGDGGDPPPPSGPDTPILADPTDPTPIVDDLNTILGPVGGGPIDPTPILGPIGGGPIDPTPTLGDLTPILANPTDPTPIVEDLNTILGPVRRSHRRRPHRPDAHAGGPHSDPREPHPTPPRSSRTSTRSSAPSAPSAPIGPIGPVGGGPIDPTPTLAGPTDPTRSYRTSTRSSLRSSAARLISRRSWMASLLYRAPRRPPSSHPIRVQSRPSTSGGRLQAGPIQPRPRPRRRCRLFRDHPSALPRPRPNQRHGAVPAKWPPTGQSPELLASPSSQTGAQTGPAATSLIAAYLDAVVPESLLRLVTGDGLLAIDTPGGSPRLPSAPPAPKPPALGGSSASTSLLFGFAAALAIVLAAIYRAAPPHPPLRPGGRRGRSVRGPSRATRLVAHGRVVAPGTPARCNR